MFKKLDRFRRVVNYENGKLYECDLLPDGSVDMAYGQIQWREIKLPESEEYLLSVNAALGTHFSMQDFVKPREGLCISQENQQAARSLFAKTVSLVKKFTKN
jgi:hypothetical protein